MMLVKAGLLSPDLALALTGTEMALIAARAQPSRNLGFIFSLLTEEELLQEEYQPLVTRYLIIVIFL